MSQPLFTIGYEKYGLPALIETLKGVGVKTVIDVRALANSRRAGFSKGVLSSSLRCEAIEYRHVKTLGTPKSGRDANRAGDMTTFWSIVDAEMERPEAQLAVREVAALAQTSPTCLLCLEADPHRCHRLRVAEAMMRFGDFTLAHLE